MDAVDFVIRNAGEGIGQPGRGFTPLSLALSIRV